MHQICGDRLTTVRSERRFNTEQGAQSGVSDANDAGSNEMNEPQVTQSHGAFSLTRTVEVTIQAKPGSFGIS
jgi:hypothetical protein